jgi:hypothetical protein
MLALLIDNGKQALGLKKNGTQKVAPKAEIEKWINEGFEFVDWLDKNKAIIRLPNNI